MQHIETVTVGSGGAASIEFTAISGDFTDLVILYSIRNTADINTLNLLINGNTSNQTARRLQGSGSTATSSTFTEVLNNASSTTANTFANGQIYIPNYRSAVAKSISMDIVSENNATSAFQFIDAWLWNDTNPITSLGLQGRAGGSIAEFSSASLYGILAGSDGIVAVS
jgi:hypothetical protein